MMMVGAPTIKDYSHVLFCLSTEVTVNWELPEYTVTEGDDLEVCATVQELTAREFTVDIIYQLSEGIATHRKIFLC